jgi:type VI secretion system protein
MIRRVLALCFALTLLGGMVSCGLASKAKKATGLVNGKLSLQVGISDRANQNSPVALDLLLIKDKTLLKTAQGMSASDWFTKKTQLQRQYSKTLEVKSWEWVPGQRISPIDFTVPSGVGGIVVFANYASAGAHNAPLPTRGKVSIFLDDEDFVVESK